MGKGPGRQVAQACIGSLFMYPLTPCLSSGCGVSVGSQEMDKELVDYVSLWHYSLSAFFQVQTQSQNLCYVTGNCQKRPHKKENPAVSSGVTKAHLLILNLTQFGRIVQAELA